MTRGREGTGSRSSPWSVSRPGKDGQPVSVRASLAGSRVLAQAAAVGSGPPDRLGSSGLGQQGLIRVRGRGLAADPVAGEAAVIVTAAGGQQAEVVGQAEQAGSLGGRLVGMEDLDPGQARGGQRGDLLVGQ